MTLIFAHRGYSLKFPENTMVSFNEALKAGADGIELDVQLSKDGEIVVIHDEKVNRTTNGSGFVKDLTINELKKLDAGHYLSSSKKREPIPLLSEVLEWLNSNKLICNIELKNGLFRYVGLEEKVVKIVREYGLTERVILSSFNHYSIVKCYRIAPEIEIAPLLGNLLFMPWVYAKAIRAKGIHPKYTSISNEIIIEAQKNGMKVRPYTVNDEATMKSLISIGCSAFVTDDPVKALKIRKSFYP